MAYEKHGGAIPSWWGATAPPTLVSLAATTWVGITFQFSVKGRLFGFRTYRTGGFGGARFGVLLDVTSNAVVMAYPFRDGTYPVTGWQNTWCRPTVRIDTTHQYRLWVLSSTNYYRHVAQLAAPPVTVNNIQFWSGFQSTAINPWQLAVTTNTNANGEDVLFKAD